MKNKLIISLAILFCMSIQYTNAQYYSKSESINNIKNQELLNNNITIFESKSMRYNATEQDYERYKNYFNIGFMNATLKQKNLKNIKSNYGLFVNIGKTFFFNEKPINDVLHIGLDVTWLDLNYTNYKIKHIKYEGTENYQYHQSEISMHVGLSVTITPTEKCNIHGYFRYAPSFSMLNVDDVFYGNYATFFVVGASVSYEAMGLGVESRFGSCKYHEFTSKNDNDTFIDKVKYNGWKLYLTYRF